MSEEAVYSLWISNQEMAKIRQTYRRLCDADEYEP